MRTRSSRATWRVFAGATCLLAALAWVMAGCTPPGSSATGPSADVTGAADTTELTDLADEDLRVIDVAAPAGGHGHVEVQIRPGDTSVLLVATGADVTDRVYIDAAISPEGDVIEPAQVENAGQNAVLVPATDDQPFPPGTWTFEVDADDRVVDVQAVIKSSDPFTPQAIDAVFYQVTTTDRLADPADVDEVLDTWAARGEEILAPHGLSVGTLTTAEVPSAIVDRFASLVLVDDNDPPLRQLCRALAELEGDRSRRLVFGIIDEVVDGTGEQDGTEGIAAGSPGSAVVGGPTSCVTVAAGGGRDLLDLGTTVWHEAGHLMGLLHTTEAEGDVFDELDDTPQCAVGNDEDGDGVVDEVECAGLDGGNFMFHDSDGTGMTAGQAFVLRNHPLLRPTG